MWPARGNREPPTKTGWPARDNELAGTARQYLFEEAVEKYRNAYKELTLTNVLNVMYVLSGVYPGEDPVWLARRIQDAAEQVVPEAGEAFRT